MPRSAIQCCPQLFGHPVTWSFTCSSKPGSRDSPAARCRGARVDAPMLLPALESPVAAVPACRPIVGRPGLGGAAEPVLDRREELLRGPAVLEEEELEAGLLAGLPQHLRVAEDLRDRAEDRQRLVPAHEGVEPRGQADRKSTRLNSSHLVISYAVFC